LWDELGIGFAILGEPLDQSRNDGSHVDVFDELKACSQELIEGTEMEVIREDLREGVRKGEGEGRGSRRG